MGLARPEHEQCWRISSSEIIACVQWRKKQFTVLMHFIRDIKLSMDEENEDQEAIADPMQTS